MKLYPTKDFIECYEDLPQRIQKQADKQLGLLLQNLLHPSLRVKKIKGVKNIWEARVARDYRFSFKIRGGTYILRRIGKHEEVLRRP